MDGVAAHIDATYRHVVDRFAYYQHAAEQRLNNTPIHTYEEANAALDVYAQDILQAYSPRTQHALLILWDFIRDVAEHRIEPTATDCFHTCPNLNTGDRKPKVYTTTHIYNFNNASADIYFQEEPVDFAIYGMPPGNIFRAIGAIDLDLARFPLQLRMNALHEICCHVAHWMETLELLGGIPLQHMKDYFDLEQTRHLMEMCAYLAEQPMMAKLSNDIFEQSFAIGHAYMAQQGIQLINSNTEHSLRVIHENAQSFSRERYVGLKQYRSPPEVNEHDLQFVTRYFHSVPAPGAVAVVA